MRIYLINVGVNSGHHGLFSPLFDDGTFEFLPIPESDEELNWYPDVTRYQDLRSHYNPVRDLLNYVPQRWWGHVCHNDPEFSTYTYGDVGCNGRSSALTQIEVGDAVLFISRLEGWAGRKRNGTCGFYLIGGLLAEYAGWISPESYKAGRFVNNAHLIRGDYEFWGIAGSTQSRRFERAIPITREICDKVFRDKDGNPWAWPRGKTELARIGSYTRTCRCILDSADVEQSQRAAILHEWITQHSSTPDAALLDAMS